MPPYQVLLGCGDTRVLDVSASQEVTLTNDGPVPVRIRLSRRSRQGWVPFVPDVRLEPGASWSRGTAEIHWPNLVVEVICSPLPAAVQVSF